jgi:HSP20 family molecular chaperone IbpA
MAIDSVDKLFKDMLTRFNKMFGRDMVDSSNPHPERENDDDPDGFEQVPGMDKHDDEDEPRAITRKFGFEIRAGSDMKEPGFKIFGDLDAFPGLKEQLDRFSHDLLGPLTNQPTMQVKQDDLVGLASPEGKAQKISSKEPFFETSKDNNGNVVVNVDVPGVKESDVSVRVDGTSLQVEAHGSNKQYQKTIQLDHQASQNDVQWRLNNGVIEIKIPVVKS